jgi:class 3 adenylate cyclase
MSATSNDATAELQRTVADLQRQLAEARAERDESEAQKAAIAEVLGVINSSPGDLQLVFGAILEKAMRLCDAPFGFMLRRADGKLRFAAGRNLPKEFAEYIAHVDQPRPGEGNAALIAGAPYAHMVDMKDDDAYRNGAPLRRAVVDLGGVLTGLAVALRKDGELIGTFNLCRQDIRPFSERQIALTETFAAQAVIAIESARLLAETREALEQRTATAEVLQVINASPGNLGPVFDAMLEKAMHLCAAAFGFLVAVDGDRVNVVALRNVPDRFEKFLTREPMPIDPTTQLGQAIAHRRIVHVADNATSEAYLHRRPLAVAAVELGGVRTVLHVPLIKDDRALGDLIVFRQEVRPFSDKQIALLENFAQQAVIAMENTRLLAETREALAQQTATAEVLQVINSSPGELAPVFDAMLEKAMRLCDASGGALRAYDGDAFHAAAMRGVPAAFAEATRVVRPGPTTGLGRIKAGERVVQEKDFTDPLHPRAGTRALREMVEIGGIKTSLWVALRKDENLLGTFVLYRNVVRPFTEKQIALVENFAQQAVIAMENARLLGELRQRTEEVAELNRGLEARVADQVEELGRVGRLKRFLAPQLAEMIVSHGDEDILESHRREIVVVFCDLRGYTAFTETAEPEEVLDFLREYHGALGPLVSQFEGTLDQFSGDGIMVFFNDPVPIPDASERAVKMAVTMRDAAGELIASWRRRRGRVLGFGVGIAQGYATLGQIGFAERSGYTAIGTVCNLAARLCAEAKDGQILLAQLVATAVEETTPLEEVGELALKGLTQPVVAYNVPLAASQPALRVIEGGPRSV